MHLWQLLFTLVNSWLSIVNSQGSRTSLSKSAVITYKVAMVANAMIHLVLPVTMTDYADHRRHTNAST